MHELLVWISDIKTVFSRFVCPFLYSKDNTASMWGKCIDALRTGSVCVSAASLAIKETIWDFDCHAKCGAFSLACHKRKQTINKHQHIVHLLISCSRESKHHCSVGGFQNTERTWDEWFLVYAIFFPHECLSSIAPPTVRRLKLSEEKMGAAAYLSGFFCPSPPFF